MRLNKKSNEVYIADEPIVATTRSEVDLLKQSASASLLKRSRICAHRHGTDSLHEMLIVLERDSYIRPHKHQGKSESFHIIEGVVDVIIFDDAGDVRDVIQMGDYPSGRNFYYRLADPLFHTLAIRSERVAFHETTNGPFRKEDTFFATWSPEEGDAVLIVEFNRRLKESVAAFLAHHPTRTAPL
jgi:cupin fold WbuC family metalloprotein